MPITEDDQAKLKAIFIADDDWTRAQLMEAYWCDLDRAQRTGRAELYLHLSMTLGMYARLLEQFRRAQLQLGDR